MASKKQYDVISPDGFSIDPSQTYTSVKKAEKAFRAWRDNYKRQGYYSSSRYGKIELKYLHEYCDLIDKNNLT